MGRLKHIFDILKTTVQDYLDDKASRLAAALAYYGIFSLAPMLLIAVVVAGLVLGEGTARDEILSRTEEWMGENISDLIGSLLTSVEDTRPASLTLGAIVALGTLLWAGTGLFANLQGALNHIWEVEPANGGIANFLQKRGFSFLMILVLGLLLILLLIATTVIDVMVAYFGDILPMTGTLVEVANVVVIFLLLAVLFAVIYKVLPDVRIAWSDVWIGAGMTALLFAVGVKLVSLYFSRGTPGGATAAAGSLILLIVWIYYTSQIVLFGAELTQVVANRYGAGIVPEKGAQWRPGAKRARRAATDQRESGTHDVGDTGPVVPEAGGGVTVAEATGPESAKPGAVLKPGLHADQQAIPGRPTYITEAPAALAAWIMAITGLALGGALTALGFVVRRRF